MICVHFQPSHQLAGEYGQYLGHLYRIGDFVCWYVKKIRLDIHPQPRFGEHHFILFQQQRHVALNIYVHQ